MKKKAQKINFTGSSLTELAEMPFDCFVNYILPELNDLNGAKNRLIR